jgi:hypothetical protein
MLIVAASQRSTVRVCTALATMKPKQQMITIRSVEAQTQDFIVAIMEPIRKRN